MDIVWTCKGAAFRPLFSSGRPGCFRGAISLWEQTSLLRPHGQDMYILHKIYLHLSIYFYVCASLHYFAKVLKCIHRQRDNQSLGQPVAVNKRPGAYGQSEPQTTGAAARCHAIDRRKTRETALIHAVSSEMRFWYGATPSITDRKHRRPKSGAASGGAASIAPSLPQGNR